MTIIILVYLLLQAVSASPSCQNNLSPVKVGLEPRTVTSPGYPNHYPHSHSCNILLQAEDTRHVLHVEVMHMQLSSWNSTCMDNLTAYNGDSSNGELLTTWCGSDHVPVTSNGSYLYLEFATDEQIRDQGFSLRVWTQTPVTNSCHDGDRQNKVTVGTKPVFVTIPGKSNYECICHLNAEDTNSSVTISVSHWDVPDDCRFQVYDGAGDSKRQLVEWSNINQPFIDVTSSGPNMTLMYNLTGRVVLMVTARERPAGATCDPEVREVTSLPSILYYGSNSHDGIPCPLKLMSRDARRTLRVEVVGTDDTDVLMVTEGSEYGNQLAPSQNNKSTIYRSSQPVIYISTNNTEIDRPLPIKVVAIAREFNGEVMSKSASNTSVSNDTLLTDVPSYAYMVYNITAHSEMDIIRLEIPGNFLSNATGCDSGHLQFLNGDIDGGHAGRIWCPGSNGSEVVKSQKSYLSFAVMTADRPWRGQVTGQYFALKALAMCSTEIKAMKVQTEILRLTSPNFPLSYALNNDCSWLIYAHRINYIVIVNLTSVDLPEDCSDLLYVIDGWRATDKVLGRVCGRDIIQFRSSGRFLLLKFTSNSQNNRKGFQLHYVSEHRTGGQRTKGGPPVGIIAGACIALFVIGGIIYVCVHENRKKHKQKKRLREEFH